MNLTIYVIYLSILLALLNTSNAISTSFVTTIYGKTGLIMNIFMYFANMFGSLSAPFTTYWILGLKWTVIAGGTAYLAQLISLNLHNIWILYSFSMITGFGIGIVKSQQNSWISTLPIEKHAEFYLGTYNSIFSCYGIIGYGFSYLMIYYGYNISVVIWITLIITVIILLLLSFLKSPTLDTSHKITVKMYYKLLRQPDIWYIVPYCIYFAISNVFTFSITPLVLINYDIIMLNFLFYSVVYCVTSYILGIFYNKIGTGTISIINLLTGILIAIMYLTMNIYNLTIINRYYALLFGCISGINDSITSLIIITEINNNFSEYKVMYGFTRTIYSFTCMIISLIAIYISGLVYTCIMVSIILFACIGYYVMFYNKKNYVILSEL